MWIWIVVAVGVIAAAWLLLVLALVLLGRSSDARALATFIPDCIVLFKRLLGDDRVPRRAKAALLLVIPYLALPFDVIPDFIPLVGQLDDAIVVAAVLRYVIASTSREVVEELWPGSEQGLRLLLLDAGLLRRRRGQFASGAE